jgi:hypothetical protein
MRLFQTPRHSLRHAASTQRGADPQSIELTAPGGLDRTASRHEAQMITARRVSADPYAAWLEQRKAERAREAHRLNPHAAWDDLRTGSFC